MRVSDIRINAPGKDYNGLSIPANAVRLRFGAGPPWRRYLAANVFIDLGGIELLLEPQEALDVLVPLTENGIAEVESIRKCIDSVTDEHRAEAAASALGRIG